MAKGNVLGERALTKMLVKMIRPEARTPKYNPIAVRGKKF